MRCGTHNCPRQVPGIALKRRGRYDTSMEDRGGDPPNRLRRLWYRPRQSRLRFWIFQVHLYCGLILSILATVIGLTGSWIVYKPEMERLSAGPISKVEPAGEPRPLS